MSDKLSFLSNATPEYIDSIYQQYKADPSQVEPEWKRFFEGFDFAQSLYGESSDSAAQYSSGSGGSNSKEINVLNLINGYRTRGHLFTKTNPVRERRKYIPTLDLDVFGLAEADLEETFQAGIDIGLGPAKLKDIVAKLQETYCQTIGAEYNYIRKPEIVQWLRSKMEDSRNTPQFPIEKKKHILRK
ncbi:MAG: 2-oxoglutarate dehydrogenase E1 component, partial [Bacteroidota bacterium]